LRITSTYVGIFRFQHFNLVFVNIRKASTPNTAACYDNGVNNVTAPHVFTNLLTCCIWLWLTDWLNGFT